jgi:hypothetical protein
MAFYNQSANLGAARPNRLPRLDKKDALWTQNSGRHNALEM